MFHARPKLRAAETQEREAGSRDGHPPRGWATDRPRGVFPLVEIGARDGAGCDASHFTKEEQEGKIVADQFQGEHATCFNVKDRGLVVIGSCSHSGFVNAVRQAQAVSGVQKVHAVMGGFHLAPAPDPYIAQTIEALKEINPDYFMPMHCSGPAFARIVEQAMPGRLIPSSTGTRFIFGAREGADRREAGKGRASLPRTVRIKACLADGGE